MRGSQHVRTGEGMSALPGKMAHFGTAYKRISLFPQHCVPLYCFTAVQLIETLDCISSYLHHASIISKTLFIVPTDAHYYKITEMLKQFTNLKLEHLLRHVLVHAGTIIRDQSCA